jgi:hypothetical protein
VADLREVGLDCVLVRLVQRVKTSDLPSSKFFPLNHSNYLGKVYSIFKHVAPCSLLKTNYLQPRFTLETFAGIFWVDQIVQMGKKTSPSIISSSSSLSDSGMCPVSVGCGIQIINKKHIMNRRLCDSNTRLRGDTLSRGTR